MYFLLLLSLLSVVLVIKYSLYKQRFHKYVGHLPSPKCYPLIGCGYIFIGKKTKDIFNTLLAMTRMQSSTPVWLGTQLFLILHKPEDVQSVLLSPNCLDKPFMYRFFPCYRGIFSSEAHMWKPSRKLINPYFNLKILMTYIPIFNEKSKLLVDHVKSKINDTNFDISKHIFACTLDISCATIMGFDSETLYGKNKEFLEGMERMFEIVGNRMMKFWLHPSLIYKLTRTYQTEKRLYEHVVRFTNMVKEEKLNEMLNDKNDKVNNNSTEDTFYETPLPLDALLKLMVDGKMSENDVSHQVITLLYGGNETSSILISHTVLMLAMHPIYQERVLEELRSVWDSANDTITYETILKLQYLEMTIKETMRLFPIAPILGRNCLANTKISNCTIPKGTCIAIIAHHLHRNPNTWGPDAEDFNPDHFLPDRIADRHPYSYIPFSGGNRNCIGMKYGWMSMKVILAHLLLNFKFSTNVKMEDLRIRWHVALKLDNMTSVKAERRP